MRTTPAGRARVEGEVGVGHEQGRGGHEATTQPDPLSCSVLPAAEDPGAIDAGAILAAVPDAAFVLDETARIVAFNPAAERTFGYSREEALGRDLVELIIPPDADADSRGLAADLAAGSGPLIGRRTEMRVMRAGGATFPAEVTVTRLPGVAPPLFLWHVRDITEWRQAEHVLRERAERLRTVVVNAPVVLFAVDRDGIFTVSEGKGLESLGIGPGEHVGQSYFELYAGLPDSVAAMRRALAGETSTTIDRYKGLVFETRWMATPAPDGTIAGVIGVSADVTERIRLEEERQRLERRAQETLQALLAMARSLVDMGDQPVPPDAGGSTRQRTVTVATRLAELTRNVIGCERVSVTAIDPVTGVQTPLALVGATPEVEDLWWRTTPATNLYDSGSDPDMVSRLLAGETVLFDFTRPPLSEGPNPFGISSVLVAPMRVNDHFVGVLALDHSGVAYEYTADELALTQGVSTLAGLVIERDRLLREREEARGNAAALRAANQHMDEFLGLASHEMRTPLTTVVASIQLAQRRVRRLTDHAGVGDPVAAAALDEVRVLLGRSERQIGRLARLVDDILDVSRIQAGRLEIRRERCDLTEVVREAVEAQRDVAASRTIALDMEEGAEVIVDADADRIAQVVTNYLTNALKYSARDQPVTTGLEVREGQVRVWVRDSGQGIPASEHDHIWERFYQVSGIDHLQGSSIGLGMGLYISRTIVERHGGQTGVDSVPGQGATFWFTLPLAGAAP